MEKGKRLSSISEERKNPGRKRKFSTSQERRVKESPQTRGKQNKPSLIPVPRSDKVETKCDPQKQRKCYSSTKLSYETSKMDGRYEDYDTKLKLLEERERSIAQYYLKVEELIRKLAEAEQNESGNAAKRKSRSTEARKMTSEPSMHSKEKTNTDILIDLENNVQEISKIWLQVSADLSSTVKHLKNNPSLDPMEFELQRVRLQLAIKQTKSLTLLKTRDILAEAKKLFRNREIIRSELENIVNYENVNAGKCALPVQEISLEEEDANCVQSENKQAIGGTGDSSKDNEFDCHEVSATSEIEENSEKERDDISGTRLGEHTGTIETTQTSTSEEKEKPSEKTIEEETKPDQGSCSAPNVITDCETWAKEMAKKNKIIANLHNKVFELQKACQEESCQRSQLKIELSEVSDKIQWNHVLRKQICKLKDQIKSLQQRNKQLESQKKDLECKIAKLDLELDRLIKLNHFLNQRRYLLSAPEGMDREGHAIEGRRGEEWSKLKSEKFDKESAKSSEERILAEKENAINQLKKILNAMKDQENFAQKQISVFQSQIEELEKNTKT